MTTLLQHYEQELGRLRQAMRRFADVHPDTAAALELEANASTDPEVERLLQSVALLNASMQKLIEDGRSDFHKALLQTLQPHYLCALPACGIIQVDTSAARPNEISGASSLPRGTILRCGASKFATVCDTQIAPITIAGVKFQPTLDLPVTLRVQATPHPRCASASKPQPAAPHSTSRPWQACGYGWTAKQSCAPASSTPC